MVELALDDVPRAWRLVGPTPMFSEPVGGLAFDHGSLERLGAMGDFDLDHEGVGASPVLDSRYVVFAPMGIQAFDSLSLRLNGRGVSACAWSDGFFFRGQKVAVVGSGLRALDALAFLACWGTHNATVLCAEPGLVAPHWALSAYGGLPPALRTHATVQDLLGEVRLEGVRLAGGEVVALDGLFLAGTPVVPPPLIEMVMEEPDLLARLPLARAGLAAGVAYDDTEALWRDGERCIAGLE